MRELLTRYPGLLWLCAAAAGAVLDLIFGDPQWFFHPVRLIGRGISFGERVLRKCFPATPRGEFRAGLVLTVLVTVSSGAVPALLLWAAGLVSLWLKLALAALFSCEILAAKALRTESMKVYAPLTAGDLPAARYWVSRIVGRDTENLDAAGVTRAAVETVAENTSDGVVAPLICLVLGGPALGFFYKAVNTLDSMIGYKNDRYLYFGRFAAKTDDVFNYLPAIFSAWMMIAAAFLGGFDARGALRIYRRDRRRHASPNSARTESVCAGALGLRLAGDASYFGKPVHKPTIGDDLRPIEPEDIPRANRLMLLTSALALLVLAALAVLVLYAAKGILQ